LGKGSGGDITLQMGVAGKAILETGFDFFVIDDCRFN
jgi:hypothetical protein